MRKNSRLLTGLALVLASAYMIGCGGAPEAAGTEGDGGIITEADVQEKEVIDIQRLADGKAYNIDEKCAVLEGYDEYSVQADVSEVYACLMRDNYESIELTSHSVELADDTNNADGKYDVIDKVSVKVAFTDRFELIPQSVTKEVMMARDASSGKWEVIGENCKKWEAKHKKFGGTSWKMTSADGDIYIRLRDTIEFFTTQPSNNSSQASETEFSTTILGAIYMNVDGENVLKRMHVTSGTLSDDGGIVLHIEYPHTDEEGIDIDLNDFEKIERDELPFTEEEFREVSDQLG